MRACIVFDTRYGNTEKVARSLEIGLKKAGIETSCLNAREVVDVNSLKENDLLCLGAPTEWITASKKMKDFLERLRGVDFSGVHGFAFETKLARPLSGSAAKFIEKEMNKIGLQRIASYESAIVFATGSDMSSMRLSDGEEERFEKIGLQVGTAMLSPRVGTIIVSAHGDDQTVGGSTYHRQEVVELMHQSILPFLLYA